MSDSACRKGAHIIHIYEELGLKTIVNANDANTLIGGSRMRDEVLRAMRDAADNFVNIVEMGEKIGSAIAEMTGNEAAFVSSGAGACVVLAAAALMTMTEPERAGALPCTSAFQRNEIIVFESQTAFPTMPYWRLIALSGARLVKIHSDIQSLRNAFTARTAGVFYFLADPYEAGLPPLKSILDTAHGEGVPVVIDAAAQLPPKSNLWNYTRDLGADGIIFSGGKFMMGPQSTGLFLGRKDIVRQCNALSSPNIGIGRPFKVGKEEYAAIYTAVKYFVESDEEEVKAVQNKHLDILEEGLRDCEGIAVRRSSRGRLNQDALMLAIEFPNGKTGTECARFLYDHCDPAIDVCCYKPGDSNENANRIWINSINLRDCELGHIISSIKRFLRE